MDLHLRTHSFPPRRSSCLPDAFDTARRGVGVAPASGSRGVYGAISIAGAWGLPKGCAVAYTDKGAGSDYFDLDAQIGVRADGTTGARGDGELAFEPDAPTAASGVAVKHTHSKDNPEADWGLRSEEHTSELQSLMRNSYAVFCLKKKKKTRQANI